VAPTALKHYQIVRLLGKGGMGEVYLAHDTKLGRDIAVKVLPNRLSTDRDDLERFAREARAVATLNHPNIVTIHSVEEADGVNFITMELVTGKTLGDIIPRGGLALDALLNIAIPLADAIGTAHDKSIIHRDLKPGNVMLTQDGRVKVLDFGLAKLGDAPDAASTDFTTHRITGVGLIVGTTSYMSPEQAAGKPLDGRSDVFSLGVVLYEMATGERPFKGDSSVSVLSSILKDTPRPVTEINPALPTLFARIIRTCLQKDAERRYQSAKDVRNELQTLKEDLASGETAAAVGTAPARSKRFRTTTIVAIVSLTVLLATTAFYAAWHAIRGPAPASLATQVHHTALTTTPGAELHPSISPDGNWIVYDAGDRGRRHIYLQSVGGQTPIDLTKDSPDDNTEPAFSQDGDGDRVAFVSTREGGGVFIMGRTGESPRQLTKFGHNPSWSPTGREIVFASRTTEDPEAGPGASELWIVDVETHKTRRLLERDGLNPQWSPNGRFIAYWGLRDNAYRDIWIVPAASGTPIPVTSDEPVDWSPSWAPDGSLFFVSNRGGGMGIWRIALDPETGRHLGDPVPIPTPSSYVAGLSVSADGHRVVYASLIRSSNSQRLAFDHMTGRAVGAPSNVTTGSRLWIWQHLSPDGRSVVLASRDPEQLYVCRIDNCSAPHQVTFDTSYHRAPHWSPDGSQIAFHSNSGGRYEIWSIDREGGNAHPLTQAENTDPVWPVWSHNGTRMVFTDFNRGTPTMFDPRKPWREQTPEVLPPPTHEKGGRFIANSWSADDNRLAGVYRPERRILIYDIATRRYEAAIDGSSAAFLKDGRLLIASDSKLEIFDPSTGKTTEIYAAEQSYSLTEISTSDDERTIIFLKGSTEADIWMAEMTRR
jgi:Tol biopolymer transport system component